MTEVLLNWAVLLATFAALALISWIGFQDLRSMGDARRRPAATGYSSTREWLSDAEEEPADESSGDHRLLIEYRRGGKTEHAQRVTNERPGYIGTESLPGMGGGALVRHVKATYEDGRFALENRHGVAPLSWRAENGLSGELPPGEKLFVESDTDLLIGDWVITCHEE